MFTLVNNGAGMLLAKLGLAFDVVCPVRTGILIPGSAVFFRKCRTAGGQGEPMPFDSYVALVTGGLAAVLIGMG